jgi:RNA polymerase sigma-70 factor (ECF subfamily)
MEPAKPGGDRADASTTSLRLFWRARAGDSEARNQLFERLLGPLRRWAHGRLPAWARGAADTSDLIQDALIGTLGRLGDFDPRQRSALQAYLRQAVRNRINDEIRRLGRRGQAVQLDDEDLESPESPLDEAIEEENRNRYLAALQRLPRGDRELLVARLELGYSYEQVALTAGRHTPDAARVAVRRAILKLVKEMDAR